LGKMLLNQQKPRLLNYGASDSTQVNCCDY
jgi:hypothetical protein